MQFVSELGQEEIADAKHRWSKFFDKKGNDHSATQGRKTKYANYIDFYHAM